MSTNQAVVSVSSPPSNVRHEESSSTSHITRDGGDGQGIVGSRFLDGRASDAREGASSSSGLPIVRSGSASSTISRCDSRASNASSARGSRDSMISNSEAPAAAAPLTDLQVNLHWISACLFTTNAIIIKTTNSQLVVKSALSLWWETRGLANCLKLADEAVLASCADFPYLNKLSSLSSKQVYSQLDCAIK